VVKAVEIRDYSGDFEDVAELCRRVWTAAYLGKEWFPLWDGAFFRWQVGGQNALCPVAYDGTKLVGTFFCTPYRLRMGSSTVLSVGCASWCTMDPDYRRERPIWRLIEALRQRQEELGLAFSFVVVSGAPTSIAYRFWTHYANTFPGNFRFLLQFGFWLKILAPEKMGRAGLEFALRLTARTMGPLLRFIPYRNDPSVRPYRTEDLPQCTHILQKSSADFEWALLWTPTQLANELKSPVSDTLVFERHGRVQGMVNYHYIGLQGREQLRAALIDLWAGDDLTGGQAVRLLGHLCNHLRERDVDIILAVRSSMMPATVFAANLFLPVPAHTHMYALFPRSDVPLAAPKTWSLIMR
jgi:hypothetical protein